MVSTRTLKELRAYLVKLYEKGGGFLHKDGIPIFSQRHFLGVIDNLIEEKGVK